VYPHLIGSSRPNLAHPRAPSPESLPLLVHGFFGIPRRYDIFLLKPDQAQPLQNTLQSSASANHKNSMFMEIAQ